MTRTGIEHAIEAHTDQREAAEVMRRELKHCLGLVDQRNPDALETSCGSFLGLGGAIAQMDWWAKTLGSGASFQSVDATDEERVRARTDRREKAESTAAQAAKGRDLAALWRDVFCYAVEAFADELTLECALPAEGRQHTSANYALAALLRAQTDIELTEDVAREASRLLPLAKQEVERLRERHAAAQRAQAEKRAREKERQSQAADIAELRRVLDARNEATARVEAGHKALADSVQAIVARSETVFAKANDESTGRPIIAQLRQPRSARERCLLAVHAAVQKGEPLDTHAAIGIAADCDEKTVTRTTKGEIEFRDGGYHVIAEVLEDLRRKRLVPADT